MVLGLGLGLEESKNLVLGHSGCSEELLLAWSAIVAPFLPSEALVVVKFV